MTTNAEIEQIVQQREALRKERLKFTNAFFEDFQQAFVDQLNATEPWQPSIYFEEYIDVLLKHVYVISQAYFFHEEVEQFDMSNFSRSERIFHEVLKCIENCSSRYFKEISLETEQILQIERDEAQLDIYHHL